MPQTRTQYIEDFAVQDATGKRRVTMADAIALAEARLIHDSIEDVDIEDVHAKRCQNSAAWAVTLTFTRVAECGIHAVTIRGGHSLYCTQCDRDVATLVKGGARADKTHEREVRALLRPDLNIRWDLR